VGESRKPINRIQGSFLPIAFLVAFLVHNLEEGLTFARFQTTFEKISAPFVPAGWFPSSGQFHIALVLVSIIAVIMVLLTAGADPAGRAYKVFLLLTGILFVNSFTHLGEAIYLRQYVPGLVTAVKIMLPVSSLILNQAFREGTIGKRGLLVLIPLGLIGLILVLLAAFTLIHAVFPYS
jgi:hypothetical protein